MTQKRDGKIWTAGMDNLFTGQTMENVDLVAELADAAEIKVLPDLWVVKIGGQSVMDRGKEALYPILDELVKAYKSGTQILIGPGGGTRARHVYAQALDLQMPTGMLAKLGSGIPLQNARMLQMLLAKHGGIMVYADDFEEFLGAKGVLFIKDEEGLYTDDPKKNPDAEFIPEASAAELLASGQDDLVVERVVLEYLTRGRRIREVRVINGLKPGNITAALNGESVGSVIRS